MLGNRRLSKGKRAWEDEAADPISGVANLSDVMLVLACGLMVAIVAFWRVDLSRVSSIIDKDQMREIENAEEIVDSGEVGEGFESMGTAYTDPETGKVYIIVPGGTEDHEN